MALGPAGIRRQQPEEPLAWRERGAEAEIAFLVVLAIQPLEQLVQLADLCDRDPALRAGWPEEIVGAVASLSAMALSSMRESRRGLADRPGAGAPPSMLRPDLAALRSVPGPCIPALKGAE